MVDEKGSLLNGDADGFNTYVAMAEAAQTHSFSTGAPIPIADWRPFPPESTE